MLEKSVGGETDKVYEGDNILEEVVPQISAKVKVLLGMKVKP